MTRYYPALIVLAHPFGAEIRDRAQQLIHERLSVDMTPKIFQFLEVKAEISDQEIRGHYHAALSKRSATESQEVLSGTVDGSRIETFVVAAIEPESLNLAKRCAQIIDNCARETVAGGRNAIFLASRSLLSISDTARQQAAQDLDAAMCEPVFPFSRCFFIDDINEAGQTVTSIADVVDLIANFLALSIASDLCDVLQSNPPPYDGSRGLQHKAYASFSCNTLGFNKSVLIDGLAHRLACEIVGRLVSDGRIRNEHTALVAQSVSWFHENCRALEQQLRNQNDGSPEIPQQLVIEAARLSGERNLDQFLDGACETLKHDFGALRDFIEQVLDQWLVELERLADEVKLKKRKLADLSIKSLLGIPSTVVYQTQFIEKPRWWQVFATPKTKIVDCTRSVEPGVALTEARREHANLHHILEIMIALFNRLDKICLNLDRLKQSLDKPGRIEFQSIFNVDLVNDDLAQKFYSSSEYQQKASHIEQFDHSPEFISFRSELSCYPDGTPDRHLFDYCKRCVQFVEGFNIVKICALKRLFKGPQESLYVSSPFWRPVSLATAERVAIVLSGEQSKLDFRSVADGRSNPTNEIYVQNHDSNTVTLIQITYGLRVDDFFPTAHNDGEGPLSVAVSGNNFPG